MAPVDYSSSSFLGGDAWGNRAIFRTSPVLCYYFKHTPRSAWYLATWW